MRLLHKMQFYISVIGKVSERQAPLAERPGLWKSERALLLTLLAPAANDTQGRSCVTDTMEAAHTCASLFPRRGLGLRSGVRGHKLYQTVTLVLPEEFSHVKLGWSPPFHKFTSALLKGKLIKHFRV